MDFTKLPLFQALGQKMHWLDARQKLISENIANLNTPEYRSVDLKPFTFKSLLDRVAEAQQPRVTNAKHMMGTRSANADGLAAREVRGQEITPNGNDVSLEEQMSKLTANATDYQLTTSVYRKAISMYRMVLGRSGG